VADTQNNRLLHFNEDSDSFLESNIVLGQADFTHNPVNDLAFTELLSNSPALNRPNGIAIDHSGNVYVADPNNNRVLGWTSVASLTTHQPATLVIGQPDMASGACNQGAANPAAGTLCGPGGVAVDSAGNLYVADAANNRVLRFQTPFAGCGAPPATCIGGPAAGVFGQQGIFTTGLCNNGVAGLGKDSLCGPGAVAVDSHDNLYVADALNSRVVEYNTPLLVASTSSACNTPPCSATALFGQVNMTSQICANGTGGHAVSATGMCDPGGVGLDSLNNLFVADTFNHRVLEFNAPDFTACTQGAPVSRVRPRTWYSARVLTAMWPLIPASPPPTPAPPAPPGCAVRAASRWMRRRRSTSATPLTTASWNLTIRSPRPATRPPTSFSASPWAGWRVPSISAARPASTRSPADRRPRPTRSARWAFAIQTAWRCSTAAATCW
jgi:hypothetical protein